MTIESHIETLVAAQVAGLVSQAEELEKKAKALRAEAEKKAAIRRQELTNEAKGGKSLWRVTCQGYWTNGHGGGDGGFEYEVLAATEQEALAGGFGRVITRNWGNRCDCVTKSTAVPI